MEWYLMVLRKYTDFSGRARRKEYWLFVLINLIFSYIATVIDFLFMGLSGGIYAVTALSFIYSLFVFIPSLAVTVRRLHDIGKSGWMMLISLIPIIGGIWLLILLLIDSERGTNKYGEYTKEVAE